MFFIAFFIGLFSYSVFALGLNGMIYKNSLIYLTLGFLIFFLWVFYKKINLQHIHFKKVNKLDFLLITILFLHFFVNLIGALGPETAFDALWYHLALPKIYLIQHKLTFIPGGLLYYSAMPQFTEMLYTAALSLGSEIFAKLIHFSFGVLSCIALFKLSRKFFSRTFSFLTVVVFYATNLVVSWESITAYVDLARTFYELMALWAIVNWVETKKQRWIIASAVTCALAVTVKYLALGSSIIFIIFILFKSKSITSKITNSFLFAFVSLTVILPWLIYSYISTGNPFFPFFSKTYPVALDLKLINPLNFIHDVYGLFSRSADPISPVYIGLLPLVFYFAKKVKGEKLKMIYTYSILSVFVWYFTPRTGGGRFIIPYLPAFSILAVFAVNRTKRYLRPALLLFIILICFINLFYRLVANAKYLPVLTGKEKKSQFLEKNLNFSFGDFYDIDGYFLRNIKPTDKVLLVGFHNLYYVDFPFVDSSYATNGDKFNYIALQNSSLPPRYSSWEKVYNNPITKVSLYKKY